MAAEIEVVAEDLGEEGADEVVETEVVVAVALVQEVSF